MAVPRLAVLLIAGILLLPAAFLLSRSAASSGGEAAAPQAPSPSDASAKPKPKAEKPAAARRKPKPKPAGVPASVARALARGHTVVLLFSDGRSADDRSTTRAVRSLRGRAGGTKVFTARLRNLASYRTIVGQVGISQSPSVVIVREGRAEVVEGFVDPKTLLQRVLDARG
jgi:hypothetical protein